MVVSPNSQWNWIPSNIWVGVGKMTVKDVTFPLAPVYRRKGITYRQAKAVAVWPEGDSDDARPGVDVVHTSSGRQGETERIRYDYLINATGPRLNFEATPGLGPEGNSWSVCTAGHAVETAEALHRVIEKLRAGEPQRLVIGMGHGGCTCEGAAFEYTFNVEAELRAAGVRDLAEIVYLSNEYDLGDFGVGGMVLRPGRLPHLEPDLDRVAVPRARACARSSAPTSSGSSPARLFYETLDGDAREPHLRLRDAAAAVPRGRPHGVRRGRAPRSPTGCSRRAGSSRSMPTTPPSPTRSGGPRTGPRPTSRRPTATSSGSASPSHRRTRSPGRARARTGR